MGRPSLLHHIPAPNPSLGSFCPFSTLCTLLHCSFCKSVRALSVLKALGVRLGMTACQGRLAGARASIHSNASLMGHTQELGGRKQGMNMGAHKEATAATQARDAGGGQ